MMEVKMAKFLEFQGKEFFKKAGIPVPEGLAVKTPEEAVDAARKIGKPVVVKAQVQAGGRGKAGGVKLAATPEEAGKLADEILGMEIKGLLVKQVLVEEQLNIDQEFYAGLIINSDPQRDTPQQGKPRQQPLLHGVPLRARALHSTRGRGCQTRKSR